MQSKRMLNNFTSTEQKRKIQKPISAKNISIFEQLPQKKIFTSHKGKIYQFPKNCKYYFINKLCKIKNTEIIEDINVTFHKGKKYQFQKIILITS